MLRSWYGSHERKRDVLAQLEGHLAVPKLAPLVVDGRELNLYGWPDTPDLDGLRAALGIEARVLHCGLELFDSWPETEAGVRLCIEARREFLAAVPVGAELSWIPEELAARRLVDERAGVIVLVEDKDRVIRGLLARTAEALRYGLDDQLPVEEIAAEIEHWSAEIPRQWQRDRTVDWRVYAHLRALETAAAACRVPRETKALAETVNRSFQGAYARGLPANAGSPEVVRAQLLELLAEAGGY